jgi:hypothetical protein
MPVLTDPLPPARCPGCGARIVDVLTMGDGRIPYYLCGSTPSRLVCVQRTRDLRPPATANLVGLDTDDVAWLRGIGVDATATVWVSDPRIALGSCGHVTIAGRCLDTTDPGAAPTPGPVDWQGQDAIDGGHSDR